MAKGRYFSIRRDFREFRGLEIASWKDRVNLVVFLYERFTISGEDIFFSSKCVEF